MSVIKSKIAVNRNDLSKVLPLRTPYVIQIDPASKCNFKCKFCPTSKDSNNKNRTIMQFKLFKKIIDGLVDFDDKIKVLKLWKDGEPLLNKNICEMIKYAKEQEIVEKIEMTTNGYLLNKQLNYNLIKSGLNKIIISVEGLNEADYLRNSGVKINFDEFIENIKHFYENRKNCIVHVKMIDIGLDEDSKEKFYKLFGDISDEMFIEKAIPCWPNFDDENIDHNLLNVWGKNLEKKDVCALALYSMTINSNGRVTMCCNDWEQKIIVGDVNIQNIKEIWNSNKVREYQIMQLSHNRRAIPVCSQCMFPDYVAVDNIDSKASEILNRYKNI